MVYDGNAANTFLQEADELLSDIEDVVLGLDPEQNCTEEINRLFRAFHTIKGSGAMFGFDAVAEFTHHVESALDCARSGAAPVTGELLDLILQAKDTIKQLLDSGGANTPEQTGAAARLVAAFRALQPAPGDRPRATPSANTPAAAAQTWNIRFAPHPELLVNGGSPRLLLDELREMGDCVVRACADRVPLLHSMEADHCYLFWDIELRTTASLNAIRDVFLFVDDASDLRIAPADKTSDARGADQDEDTDRSAPAPGPPREGRPEQSVSQPGASHTRSTVRVASERLDRLVTLVGELVINQSRLTQAALPFDAPNLTAPVEEIERLVAELRDNVLGIRMMPIGATFSRLKRLVHDLSLELGKDIELLTEGAETELDKTVLDQLGDPLVHLIRNSVDHGIETPEQRIAAGKQPRGAITLSAVHTGSNVVVSIQDDGRGLDVEKIRARAVERRLIAADSNLTDDEAFSLIFLPGFSTAAQVSGVSGRGVGMDVVKKQIEVLRGSVTVRSRRGAGTTIALTLPLTLAIIEGLLVEVSGEQFIVPMSLVAENVELHRSVRERNNGRNIIAVRGELAPYIDLRSVFGLRPGACEVEKVVIVRHEDQRVGLVVDHVVGSHQTVIQSLGRFFGNVEAFSGATIMGDGRVALILNVAALVRRTNPPSATGRAA